MATVSKKGDTVKVSSLARAKELLSGLLDLATSNSGAWLMVATSSVTIPGTVLAPKLFTAQASPTTSPIASPIKGPVSSYSPDGWPIITNTATGSSTTVRLAGVHPIEASKRGQFAAWIRSHGDYLDCDSSNEEGTYKCFIPRLDIIQGIQSPRITGAVSAYSPDGWPIIDHTTVHLAGVHPIEASKRGQFVAWIRSHGDYLDCDSSNEEGTYRCLTPQRLDVAQTLLLNGATRAYDDADQRYKDAEKMQNIKTGSQRQ